VRTITCRSRSRYSDWLRAGRAAPSLASHRGGPGSIPGLVKWDLWWTKWRRGRFSPSTSVSSAIHFTKFSILIITRGRYNRPVSGRRAGWTQFGLHHSLCKLQKNKIKKLWTGRPRRREFESRQGQTFLLLHIVQTGSGVHPTSYKMGTGGSFSGVKR
jgi:hypothetical protein